MKKTIKSIVLLTMIAVMVLVLTGCGNKLVATKTTSEMGIEIEETIEVKFKSGKASEVKMTYAFEDEETASEYYGFMNTFLPDEFNTEQKGTKVTISMSADDFAEFGDELEGQSKSEIKKQLEEDGYKVK